MTIHLVHLIGGIVTACPTTNFHSVSLGCFIEHDTAKACLRTAADVIRTRSDESRSCPWTDVGYIIPQTSLPATVLQKLVDRIGQMLIVEQHIGFFGVDLVVFEDDDNKVISRYRVFIQSISR